MNKTESKIVKILNEDMGSELDANQIAKQSGVTYDTAAKYLRKMSEEKMIVRTAHGKPWAYYYSISNID